MSKQKKKEVEEEEEIVEEVEEEIDEDEDEEPCFTAIEKLEDAGISAADIAKLKAGGCFTVDSILMRTKKDLSTFKGLSEAKIDKIFDIAAKLVKGGFITASQMNQKRKGVLNITTGSKNLDKLLGGGIESQAITELFGEFRTGKTQLCHTLCVTGQLPVKSGGGGGKIVYLDTEGTFRPEKIKQIAKRYALDEDSVLENILVARVHTHEQQQNLLGEVVGAISEDKFSLLIVDSVTSLFRVDFSGRGMLSERQQKLGKHMNTLMKISEEFNLAVVITNQVMSDPSGAMMFVQDSKKPIGGHVIAHASTTRLYLKKGRGEQRVCKIYDSPSLPEADCIYQITDSGISDATD